MYCRNIERYQYLTSQTEIRNGGRMLLAAVLMAVVINVYLGVTGFVEHKDAVASAPAETPVHMASLSFRN